MDADIEVSAVLDRLAQPAALDDARRADLEALCRKVHVARRVYARYAPGWKKPARAEPLDAQQWPRLVEVFLRQAGQRFHGDGYGWRFISFFRSNILSNVRCTVYG